MTAQSTLQRAIERRPLLKASLEDWRPTAVDIRSLHFAPGQKTGLHSHPCPVFTYIVEGATIVQIEGQAEQRIEAGSAFYEPAGETILRFDNASSTTPLHFIATYLLNGDQPLIEMLE